VSSADFSVHWPHDRDVAGTRFADMRDLILLDFGIHWFDLVNVLFAGRGPARTVFANVGRSAGQQMTAPADAQVLIEFAEAQASLVFRGAAPIAEEGLYRVTGTEGVISSRGPVLGGHEVRVDVPEGTVQVPVQGHWFREGFQGSMGELLRAIGVGEEPANAARPVLGGLQLCFAAVASSRDGRAIDPRQVRLLPA
jgi:predicted dehydrogenase